ncbi:hypothetical protein [Vibrio breoganii]|uniref:hypothetical protein n=1 Tax=Vibrio breoganii TaxID=553239 RepID=UPI000C862A52|nr:hypothetical protein [Vibrio breoganii]PMH18182.1 hypothetical protein BCU74_09425 [Vibrio breoganii]PMM17615.1 hypothetical protein BCT60_03780 [Vibrio breoganii]TKG21810.1 hypothetical protein FCV81_08720 [Vibrio breoganii]
MNKTLVLLLSALPTFAFAANTECQIEKYDTYIDASINWYQDLATMTSQDSPELKEVSEWFLEGRKKHFELNRAAVHTFLESQPNKVSTELDVESWLQLSQSDIKELATRDDELGNIAKQSFEYRQAKSHPQNYEFRSALAALLSHPNKIQGALDSYNQSIQDVVAMDCKS